LKSEKTAKAWLDGWFVYYNFLTPHLSLKGKIAAEACGINLNIKNGWEDLIREATYHQTKLTRYVFTEAGTSSIILILIFTNNKLTEPFSEKHVTGFNQVREKK